MGHSLCLTSDSLSRTGSSSRRWQHIGQRPAWGQRGQGLQLLAQGTGTGRQGHNTTCAAGARSRSWQSARAARSGQRRGGAVRSPARVPTPHPPLPVLRVSHRAHGDRTGQGHRCASTHTVIGHQGIHVVLQEEGGVSTLRSPSLPLAPQPHSAGHCSPARAVPPGWQAEGDQNHPHESPLCHCQGTGQMVCVPSGG